MTKTYVLYVDERKRKTVKKTLKKQGAKLRYMFKLNIIAGPLSYIVTPYCILYSCDSKTNEKIMEAFDMFGCEPLTAKEL